MLNSIKKINLGIFITSMCFLYLCHSLFAEHNGLEIGDKKEFWTWDLTVMPPNNIKLKATCRGIGENLYVFVTDDVWNDNISQEDVEKIISVFGFATPETSIDKNKGIYEIVTGTFGNPPDVDNDPRIYFLISQLSMYHHHNFDGFVRPLDTLPGKYSNHVEILYLDCDNPSDDYFLAILAHEFQHLIHWRYDADESSWINESLSEVAMVLCGYYTDKKHVKRYLNNTNRPLVSEGHVCNYGACLLWGTYLYERFGIDFLKNLVLEEENSIKGIEKVLARMKIDDDFSNIFGDWLVTNYLNTNLVKDETYKYKSLDLPGFPTIKHYFSLPTRDTGQVFGYGVNYLKFSVDRSRNKKLRINFKSEMYNDFLIRVIKIDNDDLPRSQIGTITLDGPTSFFDVDNIGTNYREIVLAVTVLKSTKRAVPYSFSASLAHSIEEDLFPISPSREAIKK